MHLPTVAGGAAGGVVTGGAERARLLEVEAVRTTFTTPKGPLVAVDDVTFGLDQGCTLGVVGESGSGKSVLGRTIMGLTSLVPAATTTGSVKLDGEELIGRSRSQLRSVWGRRIAMVFQDPMTSLNPTMKIGRQITEALRPALSRGDARARAVDLLSAVGIPAPSRRMGQYPHELSGGMRQRVVIAIALAREPQLLIADEPTTALDVTVQAQILELLVEQQTQRNMAMILVTHDLNLAASYADEVIVMYAGQVVERATPDALFEDMRMPYTQALLGAIPDPAAPPHARLDAVPGRPPDLVGIGPGCRFAPRCRYSADRCTHESPPFATGHGAPEHEYRCWFPLGAGAAVEVAPPEVP